MTGDEKEYWEKAGQTGRESAYAAGASGQYDAFRRGQYFSDTYLGTNYTGSSATSAIAAAGGGGPLAVALFVFLCGSPFAEAYLYITLLSSYLFNHDIHIEISQPITFKILFALSYLFSLFGIFSISAKPIIKSIYMALTFIILRQFGNWFLGGEKLAIAWILSMFAFRTLLLPIIGWKSITISRRLLNIAKECFILFGAVVFLNVAISQTILSINSLVLFTAGATIIQGLLASLGMLRRRGKRTQLA